MLVAVALSKETLQLANGNAKNKEKKREKYSTMLVWNSHNREHQKYLWNVIVLREISQ